MDQLSFKFLWKLPLLTTKFLPLPLIVGATSKGSRCLLQKLISIVYEFPHNFFYEENSICPV